MDKYAKLRAMILKKYWDWVWYGSRAGPRSLTVVNKTTGETKVFRRVE